jgi:hypothetical protein
VRELRWFESATAHSTAVASAITDRVIEPT